MKILSCPPILQKQKILSLESVKTKYYNELQVILFLLINYCGWRQLLMVLSWFGHVIELLLLAAYLSNQLQIIYKEVFIENWNRLSMASHYRQQAMSRYAHLSTFLIKNCTNINLTNFCVKLNFSCKSSGQNTYRNVCQSLLPCATLAQPLVSCEQYSKQAT